MKPFSISLAPERLHGMPPAKSLARFARRVEDDIGITVSIGLSASKFSAKIAIRSGQAARLLNSEHG